MDIIRVGDQVDEVPYAIVRMEASTIHYNPPDDSGNTLCGLILSEVLSGTDPTAATCLGCRLLSKVATESLYSESMSFNAVLGFRAA
jgi:hypothetical protein